MRLRQRGLGLWIAVGLAVTAAGACSGDDGDASVDASPVPGSSSTSIAPELTTTLAPAPTTATAPPPYSFDGSVPPPALVNTGDDYEAIYRSLDAYSTWLYAHNPDVSALAEFAPVGSPQYTTYEKDLSTLTRDNNRYYDESSVLESVEIVDTASTVATLRVVYSPGMRVLIDADGTVEDEVPYPGQTFIALLSADETGRWRLSDLTPAEPDGVTEL